MSLRGDFSFPEKFRVRKRQDYSKIQSRGKRFSTRHFTVLILKRDDGPSRLGIVVSRKIGCAVKRNRVKRLLREFFRCNRNAFTPRTDFCIIARKGAAGLDFHIFIKEFQAVIKNIAAFD